MGHVHFGGAGWRSIRRKPRREANVHQLQCVWSDTDICHWTCREVQSNACLSHGHQVQVWGLINFYCTHTHHWTKVAAIQRSATDNLTATIFMQVQYDINPWNWAWKTKHFLRKVIKWWQKGYCMIDPTNYTSHLIVLEQEKRERERERDCMFLCFKWPCVRVLNV